MKLYITKEKTNWEAFPSVNDYLIDASKFKNRLLPLVRIDGGSIKKKWKNIPFIFMTHDISESRIDFKLEEGKYRVIHPKKISKTEEFGDIEIKKNYLQSSPITREELNYEKTEVFDNKGRLLSMQQNRINTPSRQIFNYGDSDLPINCIEQLLTDIDMWHDLDIRKFEYDAEGFLIKDTLERLEHEILITEKLSYKSTKKGLVISLQKGNYYNFQKNEYYKTRALGEIFPVKYRETDDTWTFEKANDTSWNYSKKTKTDFDLKQVVLRLVADDFQEKYRSFLRFDAVENTLNASITNPTQDFPDSIQFKVRASEEKSETHFSYSEKTATKVTVVTSYSTTTFEHLGDTIQVERTTEDWTRKLYLDGKLTLQQAVISIATACNIWNFDFESPRNESFYPRPSFHFNPCPYAFQYKKTDRGTERVLINIKQESNDSVGSISLGKPHWMQDDETPLDPDGKRMEFVGELEHQDLFGGLYLFYSEKHQLVSQIFQCT